MPYQRRSIDSKRILNIISPQGNADQNHEIPFTYQSEEKDKKEKTPLIPSDDEDVE